MNLNFFFKSLTKIINRADKNWANDLKIIAFKIKVLLLFRLISNKCFSERFDQFSKLNHDFENQNFAIFVVAVSNFDERVYEKRG